MLINALGESSSYIRFGNKIACYGKQRIFAPYEKEILIWSFVLDKLSKEVHKLGYGKYMALLGSVGCILLYRYTSLLFLLVVKFIAKIRLCENCVKTLA